jgi:hypothetical protein
MFNLGCFNDKRKFQSVPSNFLQTSSVVEKVALGQVFSEYFGFACQFSFRQILHINLSRGAGTIGRLLADVPSGHSIAPPHEIKKKL